MLKHLPNLLTASRILMAPYIFYLMARSAYGAALVWFAAAAITDALDGFLARRLNSSSRIGAYFDPVADKILLSGSFLVLALAGAIPIWIAAVVLGRDALLVTGAAIALRSGTAMDLTPSVWGKWSTIVQIAYLATVLAEVPTSAGAWLTVAITLGSGVNYIWRFLVTAKGK